jgi:hypothetical protein
VDSTEVEDVMANQPRKRERERCPRNQEVIDLEYELEVDGLNRGDRPNDDTDKWSRIRYCAYRAIGWGKGKSAAEVGARKETANRQAYKWEVNPKVQRLIKLYRDGYITDALNEFPVGEMLAEYLNKEATFRDRIVDLTEALLREDMNTVFGRQEVFTLDDGVMTVRNMSELTPEDRRRIVGYKKIMRDVGDGTQEECYELKLSDPESAKNRLWKFIGGDKVNVVINNGMEDSEGGSAEAQLFAKLSNFAGQAEASGDDSEPVD